MNLSDIETEIETAIQHGAAVLLLALKNLGQGYTTLTAAHPEVTNAVEVAKTEAAARGASDEAVAAIGPDHVILAAQQIGAAGADPVVVAAETKSADVPPLTEANLEEEQPEAAKEAGAAHPEEPAFVPPPVAEPAPPAAVPTTMEPAPGIPPAPVVTQEKPEEPAKPQPAA